MRENPPLTLTEKILQHLIEAFRAGRSVAPTDLAHDLGCSSAEVRPRLRKIAERGLIDTVPGSNPPRWCAKDEQSIAGLVNLSREKRRQEERAPEADRAALVQERDVQVAKALLDFDRNGSVITIGKILACTPVPKSAVNARLQRFQYQDYLTSTGDRHGGFTFMLTDLGRDALRKLIENNPS